jgi:hypothetical protein
MRGLEFWQIRIDPLPKRRSVAFESQWRCDPLPTQFGIRTRTLPNVGGEFRQDRRSAQTESSGRPM